MSKASDKLFNLTKLAGIEAKKVDPEHEPLMDGFAPISIEEAKALSPGDKIKFVNKSGKPSKGGYIQRYYSNDRGSGIMYSGLEFANPSNPAHKIYPLAFNNIEKIWVKRKYQQPVYQQQPLVHQQQQPVYQPAQPVYQPQQPSSALAGELRMEMLEQYKRVAEKMSELAKETRKRLDDAEESNRKNQEEIQKIVMILDRLKNKVIKD